MKIQHITAPRCNHPYIGTARKLYKYLPWDYAIEMLNTSCLHFSNPRDWKDQYEYSFEAQLKMYVPGNQMNNIAIAIEWDHDKLFHQLQAFHKDLYFGEVEMESAHEKELRLFVTKELLNKNNSLYIPNLLECIDRVICDFSKLTENEKLMKKQQLSKYLPMDKIHETTLFDSNSHTMTFQILVKCF